MFKSLKWWEWMMLGFVAVLAIRFVVLPLIAILILLWLCSIVCGSLFCRRRW